MDLKDMFKKTSPEETKTEETKTEEEGKQDQAPLELVEEEDGDFEAKSKKLAQAVEDARDGMDLGDIPAKEEHPYHLAVKEHRLHESKRKK